MMRKIWSDEAWEDYEYWQTNVFRILDNAIEIAQCGSHYKEK